MRVGKAVATPFAVPHNLALRPDGRRLFVTHSGPSADRVTIYDIHQKTGLPMYVGEATVGDEPLRYRLRVLAAGFGRERGCGSDAVTGNGGGGGRLVFSGAGWWRKHPISAHLNHFLCYDYSFPVGGLA